MPLTRVLDKMGLEYQVLNQTGADIYGELNITALVDACGKRLQPALGEGAGREPGELLHQLGGR